jgi:hypothetical protein
MLVKEGLLPEKLPELDSLFLAAKHFQITDILSNKYFIISPSHIKTYFTVSIPSHLQNHLTSHSPTTTNKQVSFVL